MPSCGLASPGLMTPFQFALQGRILLVVRLEAMQIGSRIAFRRQFFENGFRIDAIARQVVETAETVGDHPSLACIDGIAQSACRHADFKLRKFLLALGLGGSVESISRNRDRIFVGIEPVFIGTGKESSDALGAVQHLVIGRPHEAALVRIIIDDSLRYLLLRLDVDGLQIVHRCIECTLPRGFLMYLRADRRHARCQRIDRGRFSGRRDAHVERAEIDIDQSIGLVIVNLRALHRHALGWRNAARGRVRRRRARGRDCFWRRSFWKLRLGRNLWRLLLAALLKKLQ